MLPKSFIPEYEFLVYENVVIVIIFCFFVPHFTEKRENGRTWVDSCYLPVSHIKSYDVGDIENLFAKVPSLVTYNSDLCKYALGIPTLNSLKKSRRDLLDEVILQSV